MDSKILLLIFIVTLNSTIITFGYLIHDDWSALRELGESCENDLDCLKLNFAKCNKNKKCECIDNFIASDKFKCLPLIGGYCTKDENCLMKNSICVNRVCKCKPKFLEKSNQCIPTTLWKSCETDDDCNSIHHAECSEDKTCICRKNNIVVNEAICQPVLGGFCWNDEPCAASNSVCIDNECKCKKNYVSIANHECILSFLGKTCKRDRDCSEIRLARCSVNNTYSCETQKISHGHKICLQVLGENCLENEDCASRSALCIDNKCRCAPNYVPISDYECLEQWKYDLYA